MKKDGKIVDVISSNTIFISPDLKRCIHYEFESEHADPETNILYGNWVINGVKRERRERYSHLPIFSKDGKHVSYGVIVTGEVILANSDSYPIKLYQMIVDEKAYGPYNGIMDSFVFSPDNRNWAFVAQNDKTAPISASLQDLFIPKDGDPIPFNTITIKGSPTSQFVVYNGVSQKEYFVIMDKLIFSMKGNRFGYIGAIVNQEKEYLVQIRREGIVWDDSTRKQFEEGSKMVAVVDGIEGKQYDSIQFLNFSPDEKKYACIARLGEQFYLVVNGEETKSPYIPTHLSFTPEGQLYYFQHDKKNKKWRVFINGNPEKWYEGLSDIGILFNNDGNHYAYVANLGNKRCIIFDGKEMKHHDSIADKTLILNPNGEGFSYAAIENDKCYLIIDGKKHKRYDSIKKIIYSPDGKKIAYIAVEGQYYLVIVDGKVYNRFVKHNQEGIPFLLQFNPDGSHISYLIAFRNKDRQNQLTFIVYIDEIPCNISSNILLPPNGKFIWSTNNCFQYIMNKVIDDDIIVYRVEESVENI